MLTQFFKSINWVDVALVALFARTVFISVKTGFIAELFKFLAVFCALFISLHYYAYWAAMVVKKTTLPLESCQFLIFTGLWAAITFLFKLMMNGSQLLFKAETTHQGFDKYAAGILAAGRSIFLCSLTIFALLLVSHPYIHKQAVSSFGYKAAAKAAPNTYKFLYEHVIGKLFESEKLNADVFAVVGGHGVDPK